MYDVVVCHHTTKEKLELDSISRGELQVSPHGAFCTFEIICIYILLFYIYIYICEMCMKEKKHGFIGVQI